eukprot:scaffold34741_cov63-Phaeocystis_antarctica.AAC.2
MSYAARCGTVSTSVCASSRSRSVLDSPGFTTSSHAAASDCAELRELSSAFVASPSSPTVGLQVSPCSVRRSVCDSVERRAASVGRGRARSHGHHERAQRERHPRRHRRAGDGQLHRLGRARRVVSECVPSKRDRRRRVGYYRHRHVRAGDPCPGVHHSVPAVLLRAWRAQRAEHVLRLRAALCEALSQHLLHQGFRPAVVGERQLEHGRLLGGAQLLDAHRGHQRAPRLRGAWQSEHEDARPYQIRGRALRDARTAARWRLQLVGRSLVCSCPRALHILERALRVVAIGRGGDGDAQQLRRRDVIVGQGRALDEYGVVAEARDRQQGRKPIVPVRKGPATHGLLVPAAALAAAFPATVLVAECGNHRGQKRDFGGDVPGLLKVGRPVRAPHGPFAGELALVAIPVGVGWLAPAAHVRQGDLEREAGVGGVGAHVLLRYHAHRGKQGALNLHVGPGGFVWNRHERRQPHVRAVRSDQSAREHDANRLWD